MQCPPEIAEVLLEILGHGLLNIRVAGWNGDAKRCAVEADHVHNLPALLATFTPSQLEYYWDVERAAFIRQSVPDVLTMFEVSWNRLANVMGCENNTRQPVRA